MTRVGGLLLVLLSAMAPVALAQRSFGYWFVAPGSAGAKGDWTTTFHFGGGYERSFPKRIGAGLEIGGLGATDAFRDSFVGLASANAYYHPPVRSDRFDPFVAAGYSLLFRSHTANLFNYGGGLNYWFHENLALRVEIRDHYHPPSGTHFWGVRLGLSFTELMP